MNEKFFCNCNGKCCREFDPEGISLFNDEAEVLKNLAEEKKIKISLEKDGVFYDEVSGKNFHSGFKMKGSPCPFLGKDNKCIIYENRPLICKAFPLKTSKREGFVVSQFCCKVKRCSNEREAKEFFGKSFDALEEINRRLERIDYELKWKEDEGEIKISKKKDNLESEKVEELLLTK